MKLKIKTRGVVIDREVLTEVERLLRSGLSRFVHAVRKAELTLVDVNGPRGGVDKVARLHLAGHDFLPIHIEHADREVGRAVSFVVDRAARTLVRSLERARGTLVPLRTS